MLLNIDEMRWWDRGWYAILLVLFHYSKRLHCSHQNNNQTSLVVMKVAHLHLAFNEYWQKIYTWVIMLCQLKCSSQEQQWMPKLISFNNANKINRGKNTLQEKGRWCIMTHPVARGHGDYFLICNYLMVLLFTRASKWNLFPWADNQMVLLGQKNLN